MSKLAMFAGIILGASGFTLPAQAQSGDVLAMTEADQVRAFRSYWSSFADSYYQVSLDGDPKIIDQDGSNQKVCFKFKASPNEKRIDYYIQTLSEMSFGNRPVYLGRQEMVGVNFTQKLSQVFGRYRDIDLKKGRGTQKLMGFFDFTSPVLKRPPKIVLYLPGLREVVVRKNNRVTLRLPFIVSLDTKSDRLDDKAIIHVPSELCSDWIPESTLSKDSTAQIETISLGKFLDKIDLNL